MSNATIAHLRKLAKEQNYSVRKLRKRNLYYLKDLTTGRITIAQEHCIDPDDCYFTLELLAEFLKPLN